MNDIRHLLRAQPDAAGQLNLAAIDPGSTPGASSRSSAERQLERTLGRRIAHQHDLLQANKDSSVLLLLQGLDASGKNGTIRHVGRHLDPAATKVASFKSPSPEEEDHHFLWRIRQQLPEPGEVVIFDRSHYEDLIVPLATRQLDRKAVEQRIAEVIAFEEELRDRGTIIVKCLLHISYDEQRQRFLRRLRRTDKRWKFSVSDLDTRAHWDEFQAAYGTVAGATSYPASPWFIIPSDHKWYRNWAIANVLSAELGDCALSYPPTDVDVVALMASLRAPN